MSNPQIENQTVESQSVGEHKRLSQGGKAIAHKFSGQKVSDILEQKKGSIKQAQLPVGSLSWDDLSRMTWEQIENGAQANEPGFKVVRKLLTDKRFDK